MSAWVPSMSIPVTTDSQPPSPAGGEHRAARGGGTRAAAGRGPVVIQARGLSKTFRVPEHRIDTLKERASNPFRKMEYRELRALQDVSFDVHKGEFFGIVGRNGSGKSTLLKIMAGIYRPDAGKVGWRAGWRRSSSSAWASIPS